MASISFLTSSLNRALKIQCNNKIKNIIVDKSTGCCNEFYRRHFAAACVASSQLPTSSFERLSVNEVIRCRPCFARSFSTMQPVQSQIMEDDVPFDSHIDNIPNMSNDELEDTNTIPGWDLIHSPPRKYPRGALIGFVVSDKMDKTINVAVDRYKIVPIIRKRMKYTKKFMAHDENEVANIGDLVMITPCHRISKNKHFMLREIIKAKGQL